MRGVRFVVLSSLLAAAACGGMDEQIDEQSQQSVDVQPSGKGGGLVGEYLNTSKPGGTAGKTNGISLHGGPVILGTVNVYYIWYGNWSGNTATTILTDFASTIGGSPYFNINTTYTNSAGTHVSNSVHYAGSTTDSYSQGTSLSDAQIQTVVSSAITSGRLPKDTNAVYFVLTSSDIKYSFVGNPDRCPSACADQTVGPNGNAGADGMASIVAHELEEATTDPDLNAWYDTRGYENADKCAWTFGSTYSSGGALANVKLGARDFLIQQNWVNAAGGYCAMSY